MIEEDYSQEKQKLIDSQTNVKLNATVDVSARDDTKESFGQNIESIAAKKAPKPELTAEEKKAEEERQKKESLKVIMAYAKREKGLFSIGMICLFLGQLSDLVIPLFIGVVINLLV